MEKLNTLKYFIQYFLPFIPLLLGIIRFKKLDHGLRILVVYLIYCVIWEGIMRYMALVHGNNLFCWNTYPFLDIIILAYYLSTINELPHLKKLIRKVFIPVVTGSFTLWLFLNYDKLTVTGLSSFKTFCSFLIVIMIIMYYYSLLIRQPYPNLLANAHFLVSIGLILYYAGTFMTWLFVETLFKQEFYNLISLFTNWLHVILFLFLKYVMITVSILKGGYSKESYNVGIGK
ncbi:hypothetical protein [Marinigracilibium pacificum]|uniref:YhhN-like protein n=1 Tax=Marinigracilibium pacificum TaxID=2729599 RepID=A0A848IRJ4_9BACT|nr:hypothetical protein [Marinigracilibium pacificum]NMM47093.1 hypothetical protein [Marinigracilibium pacificum]